MKRQDSLQPPEHPWLPSHDTSFDHHQIRRLVRDEYISLHKRTQEMPWLEPLEPGDVERLKRLEKHATIVNLIAWRELVYAELKVEAQRHKEFLASRPKPEEPKKGASPSSAISA